MRTGGDRAEGGRSGADSHSTYMLYLVLASRQYYYISVYVLVLAHS